MRMLWAPLPLWCLLLLLLLSRNVDADFPYVVHIQPNPFVVYPYGTVFTTIGSGPVAVRFGLAHPALYTETFTLVQSFLSNDPQGANITATLVYHGVLNLVTEVQQPDFVVPDSLQIYTDILGLVVANELLLPLTSRMQVCLFYQCGRAALTLCVCVCVCVCRPMHCPTYKPIRCTVACRT